MDLSKTMSCPKCGRVVAVTDQFCSGCFAPLRRPTFWRQLVSWFQSKSNPGTYPIDINKTGNFEIMEKSEDQHAYHNPVEMTRELQSKSEPYVHTTVIKKTETFKIIGKSGEQHTYHSLAEVPPELRDNCEKLEAEAIKELLSSQPSADGSTPARPGMTIRQNTMVIKIKDRTGKEQTYHSINEMPPEVRATFEKARAALGNPAPGDNQ